MQKKGLIIVSILFITALVAYGIFFRHVKSINEEIARIQSEINNEDEKEVQLKIAGRGVNETEKERTYIKSLVVPAGGTVEFIEKIEKLGRTTGSQVAITFLGEEKSSFSGLEKIVLRLSVVGSWTSVYKFMLLAENEKVALQWGKLSLSKQVSGINSGNWVLAGDMTVLKEE